MLRLTVILALALVRTGISQDLSGQVFLIAEQFNDDKCEVVADCDCCGTELFFVSDKKFVFVSRCLSGDSYLSGTYALKMNKLTLTFGKKYLAEVVDDDYNVTQYKTKLTKVYKVEFDVKQCAQKTRLTHPATADWKNGIRYEHADEKTKTKELLASKPFKLLSN